MRREFTKADARDWFYGRLRWVRYAQTLQQLEAVNAAAQQDLNDLIESGLITAAEKERLARLLRSAARYRIAEEYREVAA